MAHARLMFFICCFFSGFVFSMDLRPNELKITLEIDQKSVANKEIFPMRLTIENVSFHRGTILIPYGQNKGKSLFQLRVFQLDSLGNYSLVYVSPIELTMDTSAYAATEGFWQLEPKEKYIQPFIINDRKNANKRVESMFQFPELNEGNYAVQFLYLPENSSYFRYAFIQDDAKDPIPDDYVDGYPDHFRWEGSFASNFVELSLKKKVADVEHSHKQHCRLCTNIYKENWSFVKRNWDRLYKKEQHKAIRWVYNGPQAVLSSLPTYASFTAIMETQEGIDYVSFTYQLGKIFKFRSRAASLFHLVGFRRAPFRTSKVNWQKLIRVVPI